MPSIAPVTSSERAMLLRPSPTKQNAISLDMPGVCSRIVRMSASIWVGCHSSVSPFQTGTPA